MDSSVLMSREDLLVALSVESAMFGDAERLAGGVLERRLEALRLEFVGRIASLAVKLPPYSSSVSQVDISGRQVRCCATTTPFSGRNWPKGCFEEGIRCSCDLADS